MSFRRAGKSHFEALVSALWTSPVKILIISNFSFQCSLISCEEMYRTFNFDDVCPGDGIKLEIELKTGGAIFRLDEANYKTRKMLSKEEISCHIELETDAGNDSSNDMDRCLVGMG